MFKKKPIVVAMTSALLVLGMGTSYAAIQSGSVSGGAATTSGGATISSGDLDNKKAIKASSSACKEAKRKVDNDTKEDADKRAEDDDLHAKKKALGHHSHDGLSHHDTSRDDDRKSKHEQHVKEMHDVCGDNDVNDGKNEDKKDDDKKSQENSTKNSESHD